MTPMHHAERVATPVRGWLDGPLPRANDLGETFTLRRCGIEFDVAWGAGANVKVVLRVYRDGGTRETYLVDTEPFDTSWNRHRRRTQDFHVRPHSGEGRVTCVKFAFVVHLAERSIFSEHEYILFDGPHLDDAAPHVRDITREHATANDYRTHEVDAAALQRDVDACNGDFRSLGLVPIFTRGAHEHPHHPKRYIHDRIDDVIRAKQRQPERLCTLKVSVDCIDDADFVAHLVHAHGQGVLVQCIVDWRKMTLTHSDAYARLKRSGIELVGVFCRPTHPLIEVEPDMHTKFILFNDEECILGSFNITFQRWWANWESGMTFRSRGVCRMLDNIFHAQRGGVSQEYVVDARSRFNLLYTFGRHALGEGRYLRPHQAILTEVHRARHSIRAALFLVGELQGGDGLGGVVDALIEARNRGVQVELLLNGHLARDGRIGVARTMEEELCAPVTPAVRRLQQAGILVCLVYGQHDHPVPYSPLHAKFCVFDETTVIDGSFNWYNTSVFSHDLVVVASSRDVARAYLDEFDRIMESFRVYLYA